ncbi:MAG: hypothetical protein WA673_02825 [Candidatus Acidiferrales bacterium]
MSKLSTTDGTIKLLMKHNIPVTRENYLLLAFAGNPPAEIDGELAEELAEIGISNIVAETKAVQ